MASLHIFCFGFVSSHPLGEAFVVPTKWGDETVLRLCFVNPKTTLEDVGVILRSLE